MRYGDERLDEFERLFDLWIDDTDYLFHFFRDNRSLLLTGYYCGIIVEQAARAIRKESILFRRSLLTEMNIV
ncbi:MAG: hypothetical protein HGA97_04670 [Chlorobiaceae bacterium]|nr:hypothetical protein [Chlorobiaceae bacterium]